MELTYVRNVQEEMMTAKANVNGKDMVYVGWVEEHPTMEDIVGCKAIELGEI